MHNKNTPAEREERYILYILDAQERALVKHASKERFDDSGLQIKFPLLATLPKIDYIGVGLIELESTATQSH